MTSSTTLPTAALGSTGLDVSRLALGTMTFGVETAEAEAFAQLDAFAAAGGTLIDTADAYAAGGSERIVGLARLGVGAIDLHLVHGWYERAPVEETLDTLSSLVRAVKIHHVGWSNVTGWQLQRIVTTARLGGHVVPVAASPQYNLLDRGIELEVLPAAREEGLGVVPWSPLGGGWLTGKYTRDQRPQGSTRLGEDPARGVEAYDLRNTERTWQVLDVLAEIAGVHGCPPGQVAIAWLLSRPSVASVLFGARTVDQLAQTFPAANVALDDDELARLTAVSAPGLPPYPYGTVADFCDVRHWDELGTAAAMI